MSLYNLKDDELIREYTDFDISKSNDVDDAFVNLRTFGVLGKLEFSSDNRYIVFLNQEESSNILKQKKYNPLLKDILDKILKEYKSVEEKLAKKDINKR